MAVEEQTTGGDDVTTKVNDMAVEEQTTGGHDVTTKVDESVDDADDRSTTAAIEVELRESKAKVQAALEEQRRLECWRDENLQKALQKLPGTFMSDHPTIGYHSWSPCSSCSSSCSSPSCSCSSSCSSYSSSSSSSPSSSSSSSHQPLSGGGPLLGIISFCLVVFGSLFVFWPLLALLPWPSSPYHNGTSTTTTSTHTYTSTSTCTYTSTPTFTTTTTAWLTPPRHGNHHGTRPSSCSDLNLHTPAGPVEQADLLVSLMHRHVLTFPLPTDQVAELLVATKTIAHGVRQLRADVDHTLASASAALLAPPCALAANYNRPRCRAVRDSVVDGVAPLTHQSITLLGHVEALILSIRYLGTTSDASTIASHSLVQSPPVGYGPYAWHLLGQLYHGLWSRVTTAFYAHDPPPPPSPECIRHARLLLWQLRDALHTTRIEILNNMAAAFVGATSSAAAPTSSPGSIDQGLLRVSHYMAAVRDYWVGR